MSNERNPRAPKYYEAPDLLEVGSAMKLTLAGAGCVKDGHDCKQAITEEQELE